MFVLSEVPNVSTMVLDLSKWRMVFGRVLVEPSQIVIHETIGEGDS